MKQRRIKKKPKRHIRPSILYCLIIFCIAIGYLFVAKPFETKEKEKWAGYSSTNENAEKITRDSCLVFYPAGYSDYEKLPDLLCTGTEENTVEVHDYTLTPDQSYYYLSYGEKTITLLDQAMQVPALPSEMNENALHKISDYFRYAMKSSGREDAWSTTFLEQTCYANIGELPLAYALDGNILSVYSETYDHTFQIPLKYIGEDIGIPVTQEPYHKPRFIDPARKAVALTFDDGPSYDGSTRTIIEELQKYDGCGTFFLLGGRIHEATIPVIQDGIAYGNQYGSHTMGHPDLTKLDPASITSEVMGVGDKLNSIFGYEMKVYRPPYGRYNGAVDAAVSLPAIMWEIDTKDWSLKDGKQIADYVMSSVSDRKILLFHDIYDATKQSLVDQGSIRKLIEQGYQLVTVDELAALRNVTLQQGTHFGW